MRCPVYALTYRYRRGSVEVQGASRTVWLTDQGLSMLLFGMAFAGKCVAVSFLWAAEPGSALYTASIMAHGGVGACSSVSPAQR